MQWWNLILGIIVNTLIIFGFVLPIVRSICRWVGRKVPTFVVRTKRIFAKVRPRIPGSERLRPPGRLLAIVVVVLLSLIVGGARMNRRAAVRITMVPRTEPLGDPNLLVPIGGDVTSVPAEDPERLRLVLYAWSRINDVGTWYIQPTEANPFTPITRIRWSWGRLTRILLDLVTLTPMRDGEWSSQTHPGERYAALLVRPAFKPRSRISFLPPVGGLILAKTEMDGQ